MRKIIFTGKYSCPNLLFFHLAFFLFSSFVPVLGHETIEIAYSFFDFYLVRCFTSLNTLNTAMKFRCVSHQWFYFKIYHLSFIKNYSNHLAYMYIVILIKPTSCSQWYSSTNFVAAKSAILYRQSLTVFGCMKLSSYPHPLLQSKFCKILYYDRKIKHVMFWISNEM